MKRQNRGLSVIFATHNGAQTLPTMLERFGRLEQPTGGWNLIAVDNASTDDSVSILRSFIDKLPLLVLQESRRGKNAALNTALPYATRELVVFTDDDIAPQADWLVKLQQAASEQSDYAIFGGKVVPRWPAPPPAWLLDAVPLGFTFALTEAGREDGPIGPGQVVGPNMCVRGEIFDAGLRFNEDIGPASGNYIMGSEADFNRRAVAAGHRCWHTSAAVVEHLIRDHQMDPHWIVRRAFRGGRGDARAHLDAEEPPRLFSRGRIAGVPYWRYRVLLESWAKSQRYALLREDGAWFRHAFDANWHRGYVLEFLHHFLSKKSASNQSITDAQS